MLEVVPQSTTFLSLPPSLPSSPILRSLALQVGDRILSINGTPTEPLMQSEIASLLENAGTVVNLEIAYEASLGERFTQVTVRT